MNKIMAFIAALIVGPNLMAANGEFTHSAEYRVRHTTNMQDETRNNESHMDHRLKWNVDFRSGEKFAGHLGLIHHSRWGTDGDITGSSFQHNDLTTGTGTADENMLVVNQAYASWMVSDDSMIKAGRMPIIIADGSVFGRNAYYGNTPAAYSAFHFGHDTEFANIGFFGIKLVDRDSSTGTTSGAMDPEKNAYLFNFDIKSLPDFLKMGNVHILKVSDNESAGTVVTTAINQMRYGLTLGGDTMGIDYSLTYAAIGGDSGAVTKTDYSSSMIDFTLGYTAAGFMNSHFYVNYHTDSGNTDGTKDEHYDPLFYSAHANAGLMDIMKWGNLTDTSVNWKFAAGNTTYGIHYHMFAATEKDGYNTLSGIDYVASGATGTQENAGDATDTELGSEIDLKATHKYADNFKISAMYSQFTSGKRLTGTGTIKDKQKITLEGTWTF
jgi:hypothetical protein